MLLGFAISLGSMVLNTFVLAKVDTRLKAADTEYFQLVEALSKQVRALNETDTKAGLYKILHYAAFVVPTAKMQSARQDAKELLQGLLVRYYAIANDVSPVEVARVEVEELGEMLPRLEQMLAHLKMLQQSPDAAKRAELATALSQIGSLEVPPKSPLAQKLREVGRYAELELTAENEIEFLLKLTPLATSLREQILASINKKEERMRVLERDRASFARQSQYATTAALSLQILGLMLIFTRDLVGV
jgi:hypothetical protein